MTVVDQQPASPRVKRWTEDEYNTLTEQGIFSGQRLYLFRGGIDRNAKPHPAQAVLVIEVADSSQEKDRDKAFEYAAAGVPEYWLVDVRDRWVELYRHPVPDKSAELGSRYSSLQLLKPSDSVELLAKPGVSVPLFQLFG